jgi:hypothetical protein
LKPLQKKLWTVLKNHPAFQLVGKTVTNEVVQNRMGKKLREDQYFLSVDYANATNEIHSWCSEAAARRIALRLKLTDDESEMLVRSLTRHTIELQKNGEVIATAPQTVGQLMGSITSFPILCIVNAAICRWVLEVSSSQMQRKKLHECPLMVNGDDGLLKTNLAGKLIWERVSAFSGLKPSVGKVYFSKEFLNINSTTYAFTPEPYTEIPVVRTDGVTATRPLHFRHVPYVNMGLLLGLKRSGEADDDKDSLAGLLDIGQRATQLYESCPIELRPSVMRNFIFANLQILKQANIPWFIPRHLGGLGIPPCGEYQASDLDLRLARKIFENPDRYRLPPLPVKGDWNIWQYAMKRFPNLPTDVLNNDFGAFYTLGNEDRPLIATLDDARSAACIEALFCVPLSHLRRDSGEDEAYSSEEEVIQRYLWKVQATRKKALLDETILLPEPFNPCNFPVKYKVPTLFFTKTRQNDMLTAS